MRGLYVHTNILFSFLPTSSASFSANLFLAGFAVSSSSLQVGQVLRPGEAAQAEHSRWNWRHPKIGGSASVRQTRGRLPKWY